MRRSGLAALTISTAALLLALPGAATAAGPLGKLTQLTGIDGCWSFDGSSEDGPGTCHDGLALDGPYNIAVSPDGKNAYASLYGEDGIGVFSRDPVTGALAQLPGADGCITADGESADGGAGTCTDGRAIGTNNDGDNFAFSADGLFVYVGTGDNGLLAFARDPASGKLTQLPGAAGCTTSDGSSEDGADTCANGRFVTDADGLALSPDGAHLYAASTNSAVLAFSRNASTGVLTQLADTLGCISFDGSSEDGAGTCVDGKGVNYPNSVVLSPDGKHLYTVGNSDDTVAAFARDAASGGLTQLPGTDGCVSVDGESDEGAGTCADGRALDGPWGLDISPDGASVYVGVEGSDNGIAAFNRDPGSGRLTQLAGSDGCVTVDGSSSDDGPGTCADGRGQGDIYHVEVSPDGLSVYGAEYVSGAGTGGAVTAFRRDPATGRIAQLPGLDGCLSDDGSASTEGAGQCTDARAVAGSGPLEVSPDGWHLYAPSYSDNALAIFVREQPPACSNALVQSTSAGVTVPLACVDRNGDTVTREVVSQPPNGTLAAIDQAAGSVAYKPKAGFEGTDTFTFRAGDGGELPGNLAAASIAVDDTQAATCRPRSRKVSLNKLDNGRVTFRLRCSEAAQITVDLLAARKPSAGFGLIAARRVKVGGGKKRATKTGGIKVRVKLKRRAKKALGDLTLRQAKRLKFALRVRTLDNGKNRKRKVTKLRLKR